MADIVVTLLKYNIINIQFMIIIQCTYTLITFR